MTAEDSSTEATTPTPLRYDQKRVGRIVLGAISLFVSVGYLIMAAGMPQGSPSQPGPGMWPIAVGAAWVVISLFVILEAVFSREVSGDIDVPRGRQLRDVLLFLGATAALIVLLPILGLYISASLYAVAVIKFLSTLPWWRVVLYGVIIGVSISWIFTGPLLGLRMPTGIFF